jgi:hypothetical protein
MTRDATTTRHVRVQKMTRSRAIFSAELNPPLTAKRMENWEQTPRSSGPQNFHDDPDFNLGVVPTLPSFPQFLTLCAWLLLNAEPWFLVLMLAAGGALVLRMCIPLLRRQRAPGTAAPDSSIAVAELSGPNGVTGTAVLCEPHWPARKTGTFITVYLRGVSVMDKGFNFGLCGPAHRTPLGSNFTLSKSADDTWIVVLSGCSPYMTLGSGTGHSSAKACVHWVRGGKHLRATGALKIRG